MAVGGSKPETLVAEEIRVHFEGVTAVDGVDLTLERGQIMGLILAVLSAINAMFTFAASPLWSATILVLDGLVIYGLTVHGDDYA